MMSNFYKNGIPFHDREQIFKNIMKKRNISILTQREKHSNQKKETITITKRKYYNYKWKVLQKGNHSTQKKENIPIRKKKNVPIRKRKIFQLEKGKNSNQKKENIPIRKRKILQI